MDVDGPRKRWGPIAVVALAIGVAGAGTAAFAVNQAQESDEIVRFREYGSYPQRAAAVSAEEMWQATLAALDCYEKHGFETSGPVPAADGLNMLYTVAARDGFETVDQECTRDLVPLSIRFVADASTVESERLLAARTEIEKCLADAGIALRSETSTQDYPDAALDDAIANHGLELRGCVDDVAVETPGN